MTTDKRLAAWSAADAPEGCPARAIAISEGDNSWESLHAWERAQYARMAIAAVDAARGGEETGCKRVRIGVRWVNGCARLLHTIDMALSPTEQQEHIIVADVPLPRPPATVRGRVEGGA